MAFPVLASPSLASPALETMAPVQLTPAEMQHLRKPQNVEERRSYLERFDFTKQTLLESLRFFLNYFHLEGETQEQDRVLEALAERFHVCQQQNASIENHNEDSMTNRSNWSVDMHHKLLYAMVLLNTDLHVAQGNRKRMSQKEFLDNTASILPAQAGVEALLKDIYRSIKEQPLVQLPTTDAKAIQVQRQASQRSFLFAKKVTC